MNDGLTRLTLAYEALQDCKLARGEHDAFVKALGYRFNGMVEMYCLCVLTEDENTVRSWITQNYEATKLPR
jgi:hypothetical protein